MTIELDEPTHIFQPFSQVNGTVGSLSPDHDYEVRLIWQTEGRGQSVSEVIEKQVIDSVGSGRFSFQLPEGPYSFSGTYLALSWLVELRTKHGLIDSIKIVVSPTGDPYQLDHIVFADSDPMLAEKSKLFERNPQLKEQFENIRASND